MVPSRLRSFVPMYMDRGGRLAQGKGKSAFEDPPATERRPQNKPLHGACCLAVSKIVESILDRLFALIDAIGDPDPSIGGPDGKKSGQLAATGFLQPL